MSYFAGAKPEEFTSQKAKDLESLFGLMIIESRKAEEKADTSFKDTVNLAKKVISK